MFCQYIPGVRLSTGMWSTHREPHLYFYFLIPSSKSHTFKENWPCLPQKLSADHSTSDGEPTNPLLTPCRNPDCFNSRQCLGGWPQLLCEHQCRGPAVFWRFCSAPVSQSLALIIVHLPLLQWSPRRWSRCRFCDWEPHSHLFSLPLDQVRVSVLAITCLFHRKLLWWGLRAALIYLPLKSVPYNVRGFC